MDLPFFRLKALIDNRCPPKYLHPIHILVYTHTLSPSLHYLYIYTHNTCVLVGIVFNFFETIDYLAMKSVGASAELITSDLQDLGAAAKKLATHTFGLSLGLSAGLGTTLLQWIASIAAIYLLVLDRTNWKTNILTALLVPYIFFSLPSLVFNLLRGEIGKWIAFVAVVLRLFFPRHFPDWLEMPGSMILLIVVAPSLIADTLRGGLVGFAICLIIGCYLLQEHIRASGGFRNSFTKSSGISNSTGIIILLVYPVWAIIAYIL